MDDPSIVKLFLNRNQQALIEVRDRFSRYLRTVAFNVLRDEQDAEECENDAYLSAWNSIPPNEPQDLKSYLARIARNAALTLYRKKNADKRGGGERAASVEELAECIGDGGEDIAGGSLVEQALEEKELSRALDTFLRTIKDTERQVFLRRYWFFESVSEVADRFGFSESKVKTMLFRTREKLKTYLEKEGYTV